MVSEYKNVDIGNRFMANLISKSVLSVRTTAVIEAEVMAEKLALAVFDTTCEINAGVKRLYKRNERRSA